MGLSIGITKGRVAVGSGIIGNGLHWWSGLPNWEGPVEGRGLDDHGRQRRSFVVLGVDVKESDGRGAVDINR